MNETTPIGTRTPCVLLILLVQALLLLWIGSVTSPNRTEMGHMVAARYLYQKQQFDLFHVNPPLVRIIAGLPVAVFCSPNDDWQHYSPDPKDRSEWAVSIAFIQANDGAEIRYLFFLARVACLPLVLLGGYFGFRYARDLFGDAAGFAFLILWTFSPLVLAWGATICPDVAAASLGLVALYALRAWLRHPTWRRAVLAGLVLGLLPLTKMTWIVAFGIWPILWVVVSRARKRQAGQMTLILGLAFFVLNAGYLFDGSFRKLGEFSFVSRALTDPETGLNRFQNSPLGNLPVPLPAEFLRGIDTQRRDFELGFPSYLFGRFSERGWWYYYLVALPIKEPLGTVLLAMMAGLAFFRKRFRAAWRDEFLLAAPLLALFGIVSSQTGFSMHTRYMLPVLPLMLIWVTRLFSSRNTEHESTKEAAFTAGRLRVWFVPVVASLLIFWTVVSSVRVLPYAMSHFNELVGGPEHGPEYLLGSNVDWGQDLYELKDWLDTHPEARPLRVAYSGTYPLESLGIRTAGTPPVWTARQAESDNIAYRRSVGPQPGWFLLAANDLYTPNGQYDWFLELEPTRRIGYSLFLYHVTREEANRLRNAMNLPPL